MTEINLEEELDHQFPKGKDKARGRALVLYALAELKLKNRAKEILAKVDKLIRSDFKGDFAINKKGKVYVYICKSDYEKLKSKLLSVGSLQLPKPTNNYKISSKESTKEEDMCEIEISEKTKKKLDALIILLEDHGYKTYDDVIGFLFE